MACTSHSGMVGDPFIQTYQRSNNIFALEDGYPTPETNIAKLEHTVQEPACTVNMALELDNQSLLSGGKFSEAGYVYVCDGDEVNIYDRRTAKIKVSEEAVRKGWRFPHTKLWRTPLIYQVTYLNMHTLLLNGPTGHESIKSLYTVLTSASVIEHIKRFNDNHAAGETINNVYKIPSLERAVRYLNTTAGFPTK